MSAVGGRAGRWGGWGLQHCSWGPAEPLQLRFLPSLGLAGADRSHLGLRRLWGVSSGQESGEWEITGV